MSGVAFFKRLAAAAAHRYEASDAFARHFARGKLRGDPVFLHLLEQGLLPAGGAILDLGSGQGVLESLVLRRSRSDRPCRAGWRPRH